ncbi:MAG: zf-HC2 domain-containing protein [Acidobacteria bacterium]|nr:zf-HC2 domain-containing protein [Acidobacteriota bacterium]
MAESKDTEEAFDAEVVQAVEELRAEQAMTPHPEIDELVDYQEGRLGGEAADRVRRHLVMCAQCARELLDLEVLDEEVEGGWEPSDQEIEEDLRGLRERIAQAGVRPLPAPETGAAVPVVGPWILGSRQVLALAATMLLAAVALAVWWSQARAVDTGPAVVPNPFLFNLAPDGMEGLRFAGSVPVVEVPPHLDPLLARLVLGDQTPYDGYRVEAVDANGRLVLRLDGLSRQPDGSFLATLPRRLFPPGTYRLTLLGVTGAEVTELARYPVRIADSPDR